MLGIDAGERRVGVAMSDELRLIAAPVTVLDRRPKGLALVFAALVKIVQREGVREIVIGLPLNADGSEGRQARRARDFARLTERVVGLPVTLWDERLSTREAEAIVRYAGPQRSSHARARRAGCRRRRGHPSGLSRLELMARLLVVLFALIVVGAAVGIGYFVLDDSRPVLGTTVSQIADPMAAVDPNDGTRVTVTIQPGSTATDIGAELQQQGLIRSSLFFRVAADQAGVGSSLAAGDYELSKSMSIPEIIQVLAKGEVKRGLVATIPEGWRSEQIADRLQTIGFASRDDFLKAVGAPQSVPGFDVLPQPPPKRLEGYLFPDTYEVPQPVSGSRAAELMLRMFSQRIGAALRSPQI